MLVSETIAVPVSKGVDLTTRARLVQPPGLLEAKNSRFVKGGGAAKRRGHSARRLRSGPITTLGVPEPSFTPYTQSAPYFTGDRGIPSNWLFGWGTVLNQYHTTNGILEVSPYPDAGPLFGQAARDNEILSWNGFRLFSAASNISTAAQDTVHTDISGVVNAVMPALNSAPIAKSSIPQHFPCSVDNGIVRVVTWVDTSAQRAYYSVYDSQTSAPLVTAVQIMNVNTYRVVCYSLGTAIHMVLADTSNTKTWLVVFQSSAPGTLTNISLGPSDIYFDIHKESETSAVIATNVNNTTITVARVNAPGVIVNTFNITVANATNLFSVGITSHPVSGNLALIWRYKNVTVATVRMAVFTALGTQIGSTTTITTGLISVSSPITIAPRYLFGSSTNEDVFDIFIGDVTSGTDNGLTTIMYRVHPAGTISGPITRADTALVSKAFRVGDRTYVWGAKAQSPLAGSALCLQKTWVLLDEALQPIGKTDFGSANPELVPDALVIPNVADPRLAVVNWAGAAPHKDRCVFHLALGFATRTAVTNTQVTQGAVFIEPGIKFIKIDFLPKLRWAQAGRTTYFAGAQLWAYDGAELVEAGFNTGPEFEKLTVGAGGSLGTGDYYYRLDCCYRNGQGEEVRSWSVYSPKTTTTGGNNKITINFRPVLTRRSNSYFLLWRNIVGGTTWYLVNSRDPTNADFIKNDQTVTLITFLDDGGATHGQSDANIQIRELYEGNPVGWLDKLAAPASEIVAAGRDRLWLAGGELGFGEVAPSRLFAVGEVPSFNAFLNIQVDRSSAPMTAIGFVGDIGAFFRLNSTYVIDSDGPDNVSNGNWAPARLAYADLGAVSQDSLALLVSGLAFQSPAGFRVLGPSGGLLPMGLPVDFIAKNAKVTAAVVVPKDQEVRWYGDTTFVYNYLFDAWTTWDLPYVTGATRDLTTGLVKLSTAMGEIWEESDGLYTDGGRPYEHRIRFPWFHGGNLGDFQRVRRCLLLGEWDGVSAHAVRLEWYYDERDFWEEVMTWNCPGDGLNLSTWGEGNWGDGSWGDTNDPWLQTADSVWRWRRRPHRQKCSVFSIAVSDAASPNAGFTLNAIGLELRKLEGLDRLPAAGGSSNVPGM